MIVSILFEVSIFAFGVWIVTFGLISFLFCEVGNDLIECESFNFVEVWIWNKLFYVK